MEEHLTICPVCGKTTGPTKFIVDGKYVCSFYCFMHRTSVKKAEPKEKVIEAEIVKNTENPEITDKAPTVAPKKKRTKKTVTE